MCKISVSNRSNYRPEQFNNVVAYMESHIDVTLTLDNMSQNCSMSVSKLSALFNEQSGHSPIAYFNRLKIDRAKRLIRTTSMNISEVADSLGFHSVQYFSKLFKKIEGMTPSEYAKKGAVCIPNADSSFYMG